MNPYNRLPISTDELCKHLIGKGLENVGGDATKAKIELIGYYRLKGYMLPFRGAEKAFVSGANFDSILELYNFDEALRLLVFGEIQKLEVTMRSKFSEYMCAVTQNPFWYLDEQVFGAQDASHIETLKKVHRNFSDSKEKFAEYFRENFVNDYSKTYPTMPPSWMAIELMSFGNLVSIMNDISIDTIRQYKLDRFANKQFGVLKFKRMTNWLFSIRDVRNHCAHHNRLFNRNLRAQDAIKRSLDSKVSLVTDARTQQEVLNRIYTSLASLQIMLAHSGHSKFGTSILDLFEKHPVTKTQMNSMGFPSGWTSEKLFF